MIWLIAGGRQYEISDLGWIALNNLKKKYGEPDLVLSGGAKGIDKSAVKWAENSGIEWRIQIADWNKHGKAAGPIRNQQMLDTGIDYVIAFPGGKGTEHMKNIARKAGVTVIEA